jgi:hypothetical protein
MKNKYICLLLLVLAIGLGGQCKKKCYDPTNPQCEDYDPCYGKKKVSAQFTIQEAVANRSEQWKYYDTDTIFTDGASFAALEENAQYEWHIGADVLSTKKVTRTQFPRGQTIPITLIVTKAPDKSCFPNDRGRDSVTRWMYITAPNEPSKVYGSFKGHFGNSNNLKDTSTVRIYLKDSLMFHGRIETFLMVQGLVKGCELASTNFLEIELGYKKMSFSLFQEQWCNYPVGIFEILGRENDSLICNYTEFVGNTNDRIKKQFIGIRQ